MAWDTELFRASFDAALIVTDHDGVAYGEHVESVALLFDTCNATRNEQQRRDRSALAQDAAWNMRTLAENGSDRDYGWRRRTRTLDCLG